MEPDPPQPAISPSDNTATRNSPTKRRIANTRTGERKLSGKAYEPTGNPVGSCVLARASYFLLSGVLAGVLPDGLAELGAGPQPMTVAAKAATMATRASFFIVYSV